MEDFLGGITNKRMINNDSFSNALIACRWHISTSSELPADILFSYVNFMKRSTNSVHYLLIRELSVTY